MTLIRRRVRLLASAGVGLLGSIGLVGLSAVPAAAATW
jgi:hypothetical protein